MIRLLYHCVTVSAVLPVLSACFITLFLFLSYHSKLQTSFHQVLRRAGSPIRQTTDILDSLIPITWTFFPFAKTSSESVILLFNTFVLARRPMVCDEARTFPIR